MLEVLINLVKELSDKQVDVIITIIGLISATVVAVIGLFGSVLTYALNKKNDRKIKLRTIKEKQYIEFLGSLAEAKVAGCDEKHELNMRLSSGIQTIYLIGSKDVQRALHDFLSIFTESSPKHDRLKKQNELYSELIRVMKKDLYGKKEVSLEAISFTVFDD